MKKSFITSGLVVLQECVVDSIKDTATVQNKIQARIFYYIANFGENHNEHKPIVYSILINWLHILDETPYHGRESLNKRIRIWKSGDITNLRVEAVVNSVQSDLSKPAVGCKY